MLEELKIIQMKLAEAKGWGTSIEDNINIPHKIALIGNEFHEAQEEIEKFQIKWKDSLDYWSNIAEDTSSSLFMASRINHMKNWRDCKSDLSPNLRTFIENYEMECCDVLQRTLHLGGILGITFPDVDDPYKLLVKPKKLIDSSLEDDFNKLISNLKGTFDKSYLYDFNQKFLLRQIVYSQDISIPSNNDFENIRYGMKLYNNALTHHRNNSLDLFEKDLISIAHFCIILSVYDGYNIEDKFKEKVMLNYGRDWNPNKFKENFVF